MTGLYRDAIEWPAAIDREAEDRRSGQSLGREYFAAQQSRNQRRDVTPAKAGVQNWIPAGPGMTCPVGCGTEFVQAANILVFGSIEPFLDEPEGPLRPFGRWGARLHAREDVRRLERNQHGRLCSTDVNTRQVFSSIFRLHRVGGIWGERRDSNPRRPDPQSGALPS